MKDEQKLLRLTYFGLSNMENLFIKVILLAVTFV